MHRNLGAPNRMHSHARARARTRTCTHLGTSALPTARATSLPRPHLYSEQGELKRRLFQIGITSAPGLSWGGRRSLPELRPAGDERPPAPSALPSPFYLESQLPFLQLAVH